LDGAVRMHDLELPLEDDVERDVVVALLPHERAGVERLLARIRRDARHLRGVERGEHLVPPAFERALRRNGTEHVAHGAPYHALPARATARPMRRSPMQR